MFLFFKKLFQKKRKIKMIVAIDLERGIGKNGELLFSIKEDMQHFTKKTKGAIVIMGSTTYESIPEAFRPLKNRMNIVLNREKKEYPEENVFVVQSIDEALQKARQYKKEIWVMGGASIYKQMLPFTNEIEITQIFEKKDADTFFPEFKEDFIMSKASEKKYDKKNKLGFQFQTWMRK